MQLFSISKIVRAVKTFGQDEEGVTAIEYGLIAALIAVFIIASVTLVGSKLSALFTYVASQLAAAT
jgi:pilus assembly protein Flp/PilA|nr:Flp family type IVb pilin [Roseateles chitosanitabidus]